MKFIRSLPEMLGQHRVPVGKLYLKRGIGQRFLYDPLHFNYVLL